MVNIHGHPMQEGGVPDILCCFDGLFLGIEVKVPGQEPSKLQQYHLEEIAKANGYSFCAHSLEEVESGIAAVKESISIKVSKIIRPIHEQGY